MASGALRFLTSLLVTAGTAVLSLSLTSCTRDPEVLKRKYVEGGNRYFNRGKYREALILYRSALKHDKKYGEAYYRLALAELKLDALDKGMFAMRRAAELLPDGPRRDDARVRLSDLDVLYLRGVRFDQLAIDEANRIAVELLLQGRDPYAGHRIRGTVALIKYGHFGSRMPDEARKELNRALSELRIANQIRPNQSDTLVPLFRCLVEAGLAKEGETLLLDAIHSDKGNIEAFQELRQYYTISRRFDDVRRLLEAAIRKNPKEPSYLIALAGCFLAEGKPMEGEKIIDRMTSRPQDFANAFEVAGDFYETVGKPDEAIRLYAMGMAAYPANKLTYQVRIVAVYLTARRYADVERINEEILKDHPDNADALVRRAELLLGKGDRKRSLEDLEKALRSAPNHPEAHYDLGRVYLANNLPERARYEFTTAVFWAPRNHAARLALARIELDAGEYGKALTTVEEGLIYRPREPAARLLRARTLRGLKQYDEARAELQAIVASYPQYVEALYQLGSLEESRGRWKEAEAAYQRSYEANPENTRSLLAVAQSRVTRNQAGEAIDLVETEVRKWPERGNLHLALAGVAQVAGRDDLAISELKTVLQRVKPASPAAANIQMLLAECYLRRKDFQTALGYLETARTNQPDNSMVLHDLGFAYDNLGRKEDARKTYEASLKLNGDNGVVLNNLAYLIADKGGDLDQALTFAQRAHQKMPNQLDFDDTIGLIYLKKGLTRNAHDAFEDLVHKKPGVPVYRYHLALALLKEGQVDRARRELQIALANHPSGGDAGMIQEQLSKI